MRPLCHDCNERPATHLYPNGEAATLAYWPLCDACGVHVDDPVRVDFAPSHDHPAQQIAGYALGPPRTK